MKNIQKFEDFINEHSNYSEILLTEDDIQFVNDYFNLIEEELDEMYIESILEGGNIELDEDYENFTQEELDEMCETYWNDIISSDLNEDDEVIKDVKGDKKLQVKSTLSNIGRFAGFVAAAGGLALAISAAPLAVPWAAASVAASIIGNLVQKKYALKKALDSAGNMPEEKKAALRKQLKALSIEELKAYKQKAEAKAQIKGIRAGAKGEKPTIPDNASPEVKKGIQKGFAVGQKSAEKAKELEKLPKEKKVAVLKKLEAKKEENDKAKEDLKKKNEKIEKTKEKIRDIKK
jgi:hypothetical protein